MPHFLIVGAGASGLMIARELARAGKTVTILEARDRCGGRIYPLSAQQFGYAAEGGAEFIHGGAVVTRALMREAGLSLVPVAGTRWSVRDGAFSPSQSPPHSDRFEQALLELKTDLPVAEFVQAHFAGPQFGELRQAIRRMVEGYDAADLNRASTFALRDEWMGFGPRGGGRIAGGYGALIGFLLSECRSRGVSIRLRASVSAIEESRGRVAACCHDGSMVEADVAIVTVPLPLLREIALPDAVRARVTASADIGFGNVVKVLLRFATRWWIKHAGRDLGDLTFLFSSATVSTWWTQHPAEYPVLTGWYSGPKAEAVMRLVGSELVDMGLASLAEIFNRSKGQIVKDLVTATAINWGNDPFARGAYCYATPKTRQAQAVLRGDGGGMVFFSGEALYSGPDMGTVEAALASGKETARTILAAPTGR